MKELRLPEAASVAPDLVTRLEGKVERLEAAVSLLDLSAKALSRPLPHADDPDTLRQLWGELPSLSAALKAASEYEGLRPLTSRVETALLLVRQAVAARLGRESADLREDLKAVLESFRATLPPLTGERPC